MPQKMEIAILAKSNKRRRNGDYGYCVAGIAKTGEWIRLVSDKNGDSLSKTMKFEVLDVILAEVELSPLEFQCENAVLLSFMKLDENADTYIDILYQPNYAKIFSNSSYRLTEAEMRSLHGVSLMLAAVADLQVYKATHGSWKVNFVFNNVLYENIAMTDPKYYYEGRIGNASIVVSLPAVDSGYAGYYKFVAAIYKN